jgi:cytochrome P450
MVPITADCAPHTRRARQVRQLIRCVPNIEHDIENLLTDLIVGAGSFGAVKHLGAVIARQVVARVLGMPQADWETDRLTDAAYATNDAQDAAEAHSELLMYVNDLLQQRRAIPQDDFVTALFRTSVDDGPLTDASSVTPATLGGQRSQPTG